MLLPDLIVFCDFIAAHFKMDWIDVQVLMNGRLVEKVIDPQMIVTVYKICKVKFFSTLEHLILLGETLGGIVVTWHVDVQKTGVGSPKFLVQSVSYLVAPFAVVSHHAGTSHKIVLVFCVEPMIIKEFILVD